MRFKTWMLTVLMCCWVAVRLPAADVILNEYNAVSGSNQLDSGDGRDARLGGIVGNGGNWFELLVVEDHIDMRGWSLNWTEDEPVNGSQTTNGSIGLTDTDLWSDLRAGTLITFIETVDGGGEGVITATDTSFDPAADDWWINIATREEAGKGDNALVLTTTNDGDAGDFSVGNDDWALTIFDASSAVVFGPVGEGPGWPGVKVDSKEGGSLEGPTTDDGSAPGLDLWRAITPSSSFYDDTGSTSFGMANQDYDSDTGVFTPHQDFSVLRGLSPEPVSGDFNDDGKLTVVDIDALTEQSASGANDVAYDLTGDALVNAADVTFWISDASIFKSWVGDLNLDDEFNSTDLTLVLGSGTYENGAPSVWSTGDFNGDGVTDSSDLSAGLASGGYENGPRSAVAAVPEPSSLLLLLLGVLGCHCCAAPTDLVTIEAFRNNPAPLSFGSTGDAGKACS